MKKNSIFAVESGSICLIATTIKSAKPTTSENYIGLARVYNIQYKFFFYYGIFIYVRISL